MRQLASSITNNDLIMFPSRRVVGPTENILLGKNDTETNCRCESRSSEVGDVFLEGGGCIDRQYCDHLTESLSRPTSLPT